MTMRKRIAVEFYFVCDTCGSLTPRAGSPSEALELAFQENDEEWETVGPSRFRSELHFCSPACLARWETGQEENHDE